MIVAVLYVRMRVCDGGCAGEDIGLQSVSFDAHLMEQQWCLESAAVILSGRSVVLDSGPRALYSVETCRMAVWT